MGLDDLIPEHDRDTSGSSSQGSNSDKPSDPYQNDDLISIGSPPNDKHFNEEQWEKVKRVVREEFGMTVGEVKTMPSKERYETLHKAVTFNEDQNGDDESKLMSNKRCPVCGRAADNVGVEISGELFCVEHTAGQVANALEEDENQS